MKTRILAFFLALITTNSIWAYDFKSGDLCYDITSKIEPYTVCVTYNTTKDEKYQGVDVVAIPAKVNYNGKDYAVTAIDNSAFSYSTLSSVSIPESVTLIEKGAFTGCYNLSSITIPASVDSIGDDSFSECYITQSNFVNLSPCESANLWGLTLINEEKDGILIKESIVVNSRKYIEIARIPDNVIGIAKNAFSGCKSLREVIISKNVVNIGDAAFRDCPALTSIVWNAVNCGEIWFDKTPDLGDWFVGNSVIYDPFNSVRPQITSFTFGDNIESIPSRLCYKMASLESVLLPESLKEISQYAFMSCTSLESIVIPKSVVSIGNGAFYGCTSLNSIDIPVSVVDIGDEAFYKCTSLAFITIPENVAYLGENAFSECSSLVSVEWNAKRVECDYGPWEGPFREPSYATKSPVSSIVFGDKVEHIPGGLCYCMDLQSLTLPESVVSIGESAFDDCDLLTFVSIPDNVESIGSGAFGNCDSLSTVVIGDGVKSIGDGAFGYCKALSTVTLGSALESIGDKAFQYCSSLDTIILPNTVRYLGVASFKYCTLLSSVTLSQNLTTIDEAAFMRCESLSSITLPQSLEKIGWRAFYKCPLESITIPENLDSIAQSAFEECLQLTSVVWNARQCKQSAFYYIKNQITSFTLGDNVEYIPSSLCSDMVGLSSISIGRKVKTINRGAFSGCSSLKEVNYDGDVEDWCRIKFANATSNPNYYAKNLLIGGKEVIDVEIPNVVDSINDYAFYGCTKLSSLIIPESVKSVGQEAFGECSKLYDIYCHATEPPVANNNSFTNYNVYLYVPCESLRNYQMDMVFGSFKYIQCNEADEYYKVTYLVDGEVYQEVNLLSGDKIVLIEEPVKEGHTFSGWSKAPETMPNEDVIISGSFTINTYKVYYYVGEELVHTAEVTYGDVIPEYVYVSTAEGDEFLGWVGEAYDAMPAHDVSYTANMESDAGEEPAEEWGEWTALGTAVTIEGKDALISTLQYWGDERNVAWEEPISIDLRAKVDDPTKQQLRLNDIFNSRDIILDYDSSTSKITAKEQGTGYAINTTMLEQTGVYDSYEEFVFSLNNGTYRSATGVIDLSNAFFVVSDLYGFQLGFSLQIQNVIPPTFTATWNCNYVGREGGEATLTIDFEEPIVKYRKLVLAPGESVTASDVSALYAAQPKTDLEYEESAEPTINVLCSELGTYRVVLVPIGADGTAILNYQLYSIVSYAEPNYKWEYLGESIVTEHVGSLLIPSEEMWEEVDGAWERKYPCLATTEGVETFCRTDNPNIIGLRNLYGENHPYRSMFDFVDQTQDWWIYIDVTNPNDVKLLTTPVGAISSQVGYATFVNQYANAETAVYSNGVITFPYGSVLLNNLLNQDYNAEFDMKIILPKAIEEAISEIEIKHSEVKYFNLKGQRIDRPDGGLYIEYNKGKVTKRL